MARVGTYVLESALERVSQMQVYEPAQDEICMESRMRIVKP